MVDAGLVALAYYLAYRLRFDGGIPSDYQELFEHTMSFVVIGSVAIFAGFGLYRHWMRYSSQREYLRIVQAVVTAVLALVAYVAVVKPKEIFVGYPRGFVSVSIPTGVLVIYGPARCSSSWAPSATRCTCTSSARSAATAPAAARARC